MVNTYQIKVHIIITFKFTVFDHSLQTAIHVFKSKGLKMTRRPLTNHLQLTSLRFNETNELCC